MKHVAGPKPKMSEAPEPETPVTKLPFKAKEEEKKNRISEMDQQHGIIIALYSLFDKFGMTSDQAIDAMKRAILDIEEVDAENKHREMWRKKEMV